MWAPVFGVDEIGETTKNVTGSPYPVSKSRMLCALSVDVLCCFGAKNFQVVRKSYSVEALPGPWHGSLGTVPCRCAVLVRQLAQVDTPVLKKNIRRNGQQDGTP